MKIKQHVLSGFIIAATILVGSGNSFAQQYGPLAVSEAYILKSTFNQKNYTIQISLPKSYLRSDTSTYEVLYVLDGNYSFNIYHSARAMMDLGKEIEELIIVGIDSECNTDKEWFINRHHDYTPSNNPEADKLWSKILNLPEGKLYSGGAASFLSTLESDIIPFVEKNYKTRSERGLTGHSLSGLFTAYCLFQKPNLFSKYGINSPSLWWNDFEITKMEKKLSASSIPLNTNVFLSVGDLEGDMMTAPCKKFMETLTLRNYNGLKLESQIFEKETHLSVPMVSSSRTLKVLYKSVNKN
jgi:predicted alpha/beta superfamily hydrolase